MNREFPSPTRILVFANCQTGGLAACLSLFLPGCQVAGQAWSTNYEQLKTIAEMAESVDVLVTSATPELQSILIEHGVDRSKFLLVPSLHFGGFHPDLTSATANGKQIASRVAHVYQSAIGVWCWKQGLDPKDAERLFTAHTMRILGYDRSWSAATEMTRGQLGAVGIPFADVFLPLQASARVFMHTTNHPHISFIAELARVVARRLGATNEALSTDIEGLVPDALLQQTVWPVYPGVGEALGLPSSLIWKYGHSYYDLTRYLEAQFEALDAADGPVICAQADNPQFDAAMRTAMAAR